MSTTAHGAGAGGEGYRAEDQGDPMAGKGPTPRVLELRDAAWLHARYLDDGRSLGQIAAELGCSKQLVHAWLRHWAIPARQQTRFAHVPALADRTWLHARYVGEGRTATGIAVELGCSVSTVLKALRVHGIPARRPGAALRGRRFAPGADRLEDGDWLRERYVGEGRSCRQIAETLGCGAMTVYRALRRHGVGRRPAGNRRRFVGDDSLGADNARTADPQQDRARSAALGTMHNHPGK